MEFMIDWETFMLDFHDEKILRVYRHKKTFTPYEQDRKFIDERIMDEIGDYKDAKYFIRKDESLFPEYSMQLVIKYDEEIFLKEKERLESAYTYLDKPQKLDVDKDVYTIPIEEFSFAGFDFKIAVFEDTNYPKNFGMVGVSDEKCEIAYLWIYAVDLDYICEADENEIKAMSEFMEYHFSLE